MLGLNFSPLSKRLTTREDAEKIIHTVRPRFPDSKFVGIFVDQPREFVQTIAEDLRLDAVQLHGNETPEYVHSIQAPFVIKALRVGSKAPRVDASSYGCDAILLDSWNEHAPGGTGETFPWWIAAELRATVDRLILAGGLTAGNVEAAVAAVHPFAVDVCSGVEEAPGRKSADKVHRFIEHVRQAEDAAAALR